MTPIAAATPLVLLLAQAPAEAPPPYRVGPGDVLEVVVDGRPDLSRLPTVQTTGGVFLPRTGEVPVQGLTTDEIAARVAPLLAGADLASPRVAVRVKEYQSQFVWVRGAVQRPGRKPLRQGTRLVDALLDAGGFVEGASGEVVIDRSGGTFADGSRSARFRFASASPTPVELEQLGLPLLAGDVITAGIQRWVFVSGAVRKPSRYPFEDALTLSRLIEQAGGILRTASDRVVVRRAGGEIEADLGAIRDGKAQDVVLAPGDEVVVRARQL
jgi:protein involved in polysaccharide export with SLBB domain